MDINEDLSAGSVMETRCHVLGFRDMLNDGGRMK
jgi:hypothetical protein